MTTTGFVILVILAMVVAVIYIELASMPGKTARERGHPQADAINMLGWIGLLLGVGPWLVAMVWSRMQPLQAPGDVAVARKGSEDD